MAVQKRPEEKSKLRQPGPKKSGLGLQVPEIKLPHMELVDALNNGPEGGASQPTPDHPTQPRADSSAQTTLPTPPLLTADHAPQTTPPSPDQPAQPSPDHAAHPTHTKKRVRLSAAPPNNFHRVDNSITDGIPEYFRSGKTKLVYDVLYKRSRGAHVPVRTIQIPKAILMQEAGIGSRNTLEKILGRLKLRGLVEVTWVEGDQAGNIFEIFTPKEVGLESTSDQRSPAHSTHTAQPDTAPNQDSARMAENAPRAQGLNIDVTGTSRDAKTFFKDFLNPDDEEIVLAAFDRLNTACKAATGKPLRRSDWEGFAGIVDWIIQEANAAGARTNGISVYLKFAEAVVRRKGDTGGRKPGKKKDRLPIEFFTGSQDGFSPVQIDEFANTYLAIVAAADAPTVDVSDEDQAVWTAMSEIMAGKLNRDVYKTWFRPVVFEGIEGNNFKLRAGRVTADWIGLYYTELIETAGREAGYPDIAIMWNIVDSMDSVEEFERQFTPEVWQQILARAAEKTAE